MLYRQTLGSWLAGTIVHELIELCCDVCASSVDEYIILISLYIFKMEPTKTNNKFFIIAIIVCSLLILAVSIILYFTKKDSDSSETTVVTDSESSIQIQITESYLAGLSSFSETIVSLNDDYKTELNDYVNLDVESDNLLVSCQALDICDEDKTELSDDEKTAIKNWIIDDGYFCVGRDCYVTNGRKYHSDTSEWTDKTENVYVNFQWNRQFWKRP